MTCVILRTVEPGAAETSGRDRAQHGAVRRPTRRARPLSGCPACHAQRSFASVICLRFLWVQNSVSGVTSLPAPPRPPAAPASLTSLFSPAPLRFHPGRHSENENGTHKSSLRCWVPLLLFTQLLKHTLSTPTTLPTPTHKPPSTIMASTTSTSTLESVKNTVTDAVNYVTESVSELTSASSKESNKEVAKGNTDASLSDRASAGLDAVGDKVCISLPLPSLCDLHSILTSGRLLQIQEEKHSAKADANKESMKH
ncbi:SPOSA6832_02801, partial [Sporobolomyces salmonicolor]